MNSESPASRHQLLRKVIEITLQLALLIFIFGWCLKILFPFLRLIVWGLIIAITVFPIHKILTTKLGNRRKLSSILISLVLVSIILVPVFFLGESMVQGIKSAHTMFIEKKTIIPPPGDEVANWPSFTKPLVDQWQATSENLKDAVIKYEAPLMKVGRALFEFIGRTGLGILEFVLSIIIGGIFLIYATEGGSALRQVFTKVAGDRGHELAALSEDTIRTVVKGVLGIAVIQTLMACVGFIVAGVPFAGLLTFLCLIFAIIQVGVVPVVLPVCIYLFFTGDTTTAIFFTLWCIVILITDNLLKPILLGRGAPVPTVVVFLGAVGGMMASGLIGLFLGSVILSLGYKLFHSWLYETSDREEEIDTFKA